MPIRKTQKPIGGSKVSILDLNRALAPTVKRTIRQSCHDYEGAYKYFQIRVVDQDTGVEEKTWVRQGEKGTSLEGKWFIEVRLHSMPLYWKLEPYLDASGKEVVDTIYKPNGEVREERQRFIGYSRYQVDNEEQGWQILRTLAAEEDEVFKGILTRAAAALKNVDDYENDDIAEKAKEIYNSNEAWVQQYGEWDVRDVQGRTRMSFSPEKTNKKNNAKQTARAALGYTRAKIVDRSVEE